MAYDPNEFPKVPQEVKDAIDALQEAAIMLGEGQGKYSTMRDKRQSVEIKIAGILYGMTREAYKAGADSAQAAKS